MITRRGGLALLTMLLLGGLLYAGPAQAHAGFKRSEPPADGRVAQAPTRVDVWFTQEVFRRAGENWLRVTGPDGAEVQTGETQIDDDDRAHLWVALQPGLPAGVYTVTWRSLSSEDGHGEEGVFTFTVDPSAPAATATPAPAAVAATPAPAPTPASGPAGELCGPGLAPVAGLIGLAVVRRRPRR